MLTAIFPVEPWLAVLLKLRMMVTTGTVSRATAKLQSNHHHQQTNTKIFTGRMPFLSPKQHCQSIEGKHQGRHHLYTVFSLLWIYIFVREAM